MSVKAYVVAPEKIANLSRVTHEFYLDFEPEYVFGFSPESLENVCRSHSGFAAKFVEVVEGMLPYYCCDMTKRPRPGTTDLHSDFDWLRYLTMCAKSFLPVFLPEPKVGQMLFPILFARLPIFRNGSNPDTREVYTANAPLVLTHTQSKRGTTTITFVGEELRQREREVYARLLNEVARSKKPLSEDQTRKFREVLQSMPGRGVGGDSRKTFRAEAMRLKGTTLTIRTTDPVMIEVLMHCLPKNESVKQAHVAAQKGKDALKKAQEVGKGLQAAQRALEAVFIEISFSLLDSFTHTSEGFTFRLSREARGLFGEKLSFGYDEETYYTLPKRGYARQLYVFYSSHYNCWPLTTAELRDKLGSDVQSISNFKGEMDKAHAALEALDIIPPHEYRRPTKNVDGRDCQEKCYIVRRPGRSIKTLTADEVTEA
jgi:hypothetical protein